MGKKGAPTPKDLSLIINIDTVYVLFLPYSLEESFLSEHSDSNASVYPDSHFFLSG